MGSGCQINHKTFTNPAPTGFLPAPLNATAGVGELFAIKQSATGTNHPVAEVAAGAKENLPILERMGQGCDFLRVGHWTRLKIGRGGGRSGREWKDGGIEPVSINRQHSYEKFDFLQFARPV